MKNYSLLHTVFGKRLQGFLGCALPVVALLTTVSLASAQTLFVGTESGGKVMSYNVATGSVTNNSLVSGFTNIYSLTTSSDTLYVGDIGNSKTGAYGFNGSTINATLVSGYKPIGLSVSGTTLLVGNYQAGTISSFNATTGTSITHPLITGSGQIWGFAQDSSANIYLVDRGTGKLEKYSSNGTHLTTLATGLGSYGPFGIAVDNSTGDVYVAQYSNSAIGKWEAGSGNYTYFRSSQADINQPTGLAIRDGHLYVGNYGTGTVTSYNLSNGTKYNEANWITGVSGVTAIAFIPEPGSALLVMSAGALFLVAWRRRQGRLARA